MKIFKKYKKIIALVLAIMTMCLCFTGCGQEEVLSPEEQMLIDGTLLQPSQNSEFKFNIYTTYVEITEYIGESSEVTIPAQLADKPVLSIVDSCFEDNLDITKVTISDSVIRLGTSLFAGCENLTEVVLPKTIKGIPDGLCRNCISLVKFNIPDTITTVGDGAFSGCAAITKIIIPRTITTIGESSFAGCEKLEEIIIQDGGFVKDGQLVKMNNLVINSCAFSWNQSLKKVVVPASIAKMEIDAFQDCGEETMFYGYVPSIMAEVAALPDNKYKFTPIVPGDAIDKEIRLEYTTIAEGITPSVQ